jgi:hypothetical protein
MNAFKRVSLFTYLLILSSCTNREIDVGGQVFIVRNDRETIRLSGVQICTAGKESFLIFERVRDQIRRLEESTSVGSEVAHRKRKVASAAHEASKNDFDKNGSYVKSLRTAIQNTGESMQFMTATQRLEAAKLNRARQVKLNSALEKKREFAAAVEKFERERDAADAVERQALKATADLDKEKKRLIYGGNLPRLNCKTMTDADGRFILKVPSLDSTIIVVRSERLLPLNGKEYYCWAEPLKGTNVLLSNANLLVGWTEKEGED